MTPRAFTKVHHPDIPGSDTSVHPDAFPDMVEKGWVEGEAEPSPSPTRVSRNTPPRTDKTINNDPEED